MLKTLACRGLRVGPSIRKIRAPIKIKSALPPPLKRGILWTQVFLQKEGIFPGVHKIGAAISGPRIADKNFTDTRIFLILSSGHGSGRSCLIDLFLAISRGSVYSSLFSPQRLQCFQATSFGSIRKIGKLEICRGKNLAPYRIGKHSNNQNSPPRNTSKIRQKMRFSVCSV